MAESAVQPEISSEEMSKTAELYKEWKLEEESTKNGPSASVEHIPRFFTKAPEVEDELQQKIREEARSKFLQRKNLELLDNTELKDIWAQMEEFHTPPVVDDEKMIGYDNYRKFVKQVNDKAKPFFTAALFGKLQQRDPYGRISIVTLFNYVMRKTWLRQSRIGLSLYDVTGQGFLTEKDLELYISELIPTMPQLERLEESFHSFYICTAVRRFLFFLDPKRLGRVRIVDILASGFLDDLLELRDAPADASADGTNDTSLSGKECETPRTPEDSIAAAVAAKMEKNWFSAANALRVYGQYLNLDTDRNGMLSQAEMKEYGSGLLSDTFIQRVFQECLTYEGEVDYKGMIGYLDFVLAMETKKDRAALEYFFRILDVRQKGYLDAFAINFFFRDIQKMLEAEDQQMVTFEDVKDEIFDMVKPNDPLKIRLSDMISSKQGDTVVNILTDLDGFYKYENREILATDPDNEEEAEC